jgi:hypothetical protein
MQKAKLRRSELLALHAASPAPSTDMPDLKTMVKKINAGRNGKSPGPLGDTYELWKNCGARAQSCLGRLFQLFWLSGHIPASINGSYLILLKKDRSEADRVKGYRPITLLNTVVKLYESVLLERLTSHVNKHGALSRLQHACRPGRGASHAIGHIYDTIHQNPKLCLVTLDASKAFDRVNHDILFQRLADTKGVGVALWKAIHSTYEHARTSTRIEATVSKDFSLPCGVRQGAVLSPLLFAIYIDPLLRSIDSLDTSLRTNGLRSPAQGFVDDLLVTASNIQDMESILETTEKFCHDNGAVINWAKTAIAQNRMAAAAASISDTLGLANSCTKPYIKYLGHWLSPKTSPDFWSAHAEDRCAKAKKAFNILGRRGLRQRDDSIHAGLLLYDAIIDPILFYGAEHWSSPPETLQKIDRVQAHILKEQLGLHYLTPTPWVLWETATLPAEVRLGLTKLKQWGNHIRRQHKEFKMRTPPADGIEPRPKATAGSSAVANILHRWDPSISPEEADEITRPPASAQTDSKRTWNEWCEELANTRHEQTFKDWAENSAENDSQSLASLKPDRPRHALISNPQPLKNSAITAALRLRSATLGLRGDWSRRRKLSTTANYCPSCIRDHDYTHLDNLHAALHECKALRVPSLKLHLSLIANGDIQPTNTFPPPTKKTAKATRRTLRVSTPTGLTALSTFLQAVEDKIRLDSEPEQKAPAGP